MRRNAQDLLLLPNLGGEEGADWRRFARKPAVARTTGLWASLFGDAARLPGMDRPASAHESPAYDWLPRGPGVVAWLGDRTAAADAEARGRRWLGAPPEVVTSVHDKAFAVRHATLPPGLRGLTRVFDAEELESPDAAMGAIREVLAAWPEALRERFCLKPRFGSSGRGRALGHFDELDELDNTSLRGALPRLARRGGAILEPWLERTADLSVSFHVSDARSGPPLELLGSLTSISSDAGVPIAHCGEIDRRGRIESGSIHDADARADASELALAAYEAGYRGPCGIDAFAYRDDEGRDRLRPAVELNARFTLGIVALGCLRRARARLRETVVTTPDARAGVLVAHSAPRGGWQEFDVELLVPIEILPGVDPMRGPAILAASEPETLAPVIRALTAAPGHRAADGSAKRV